ncbi:MAG: hypothetical protein WCW44_00725 [archaeon]
MENSFPKEMTPDLAEICGIHAGDGYLRRRGSKFELDLSGNVDEKEYYDNHVVPLFERTFGIKIKPRFFYPRNTYGFLICKREVCEFIHSFGFPYGKKTLTVGVPKQIFESKNIEIIYGFIRGVFDTDGTLSFRKRGGSKYSEIHKKRHTYSYLKLSVCSKSLRDGVGLLLMQTGFQFAFSQTKETATENIAYNLTLQGDQNLILWMRNIGFKNPVKTNRYLIWKTYGFNPPYITLEQQKEILAGKLNPHDFYPEKILEESEVLPKLVAKRLASIQVLESVTPKG